MTYELDGRAMVSGSGDGVQTPHANSGVDVITRHRVHQINHVDRVAHLEPVDANVRTDQAEEAQDLVIDGEFTPAEPVGPWRSWRSWRSWYCLGLLVADAVAAVLALGFCYLVRPAAERSGLDVLDWRIDYKMLGVLALGVWLAALMLAGSYRSQYPGEGLREYRVPVVTALRLMALVAIASFAVHAPVSRLLVVVFFPSLVVACLFTRWLMRQLVSRLRRKGYGLNRVILAGDEGSVEKFAEHLFRDPSHGYQVVGVCVPGGSREAGTRTSHRAWGVPDPG